MGQALYRKYRSKKLSEIVGQQHITTALDNALRSGRISHAYLFTGPRGVGKTSIARILAHEINDLPYTDEATHLDIIEIDAASNRRIDEIRDLRDKVHIAPSGAKYKVYIIDEVHMLTKEAFNALLKTLEEPPAHVVFILATTEAHKLPETIVSRTQRFTFKPVSKEQVIEHLAEIAATENIQIEPEALALLAEHGGGSFRDSISLLDQTGNSGGKVTAQDVHAMLGIAPESAIEQLMQAIAKGTPGELHEQLQGLREQGITAVNVAKQLSAALRRDLVSGKAVIAPLQSTALLEKLLTVPSSSDPDVQFEIILFEAVLARTPPGAANPQSDPAQAKEAKSVKAQPIAHDTMTIPAAQARAETKQASHAATEAKAHPSAEAEEIIDLTAAAKPAVSAATNTSTSPAKAAEPSRGITSNDVWPALLTEVKCTQNTLYGVLRLAQPSWQGNELTLSCRFPFHQKRINDTKNRSYILEVVQRLYGQPVTLMCNVVEGLEVAPPPLPAASFTPENASDAMKEPEPAMSSPLDTLKNVFGGIEVLES